MKTEAARDIRGSTTSIFVPASLCVQEHLFGRPRRFDGGVMTQEFRHLGSQFRSFKTGNKTIKSLLYWCLPIVTLSFLTPDFSNILLNKISFFDLIVTSPITELLSLVHNNMSITGWTHSTWTRQHYKKVKTKEETDSGLDKAAMFNMPPDDLHHYHLHSSPRSQSYHRISEVCDDVDLA